jgi:heptosyltransferase-2
VGEAAGRRGAGPPPALDDVLVEERRGRHAGVIGRFRLAADVRRRGFDAALLLTNSFESALVAALAGVPRRIGYRTDGRALLLTVPLHAPLRVRMPHMTAYYLDLLAPWTLAGDPLAVSLTVTDEERDAARARLSSGGGAGRGAGGHEPRGGVRSASAGRPPASPKVARRLIKMARR